VGSIHVSHLGWRLPGGADLLEDVSFNVGDGERAALVGANGVGKSTLMRLVAGELTPTAGTITIDGRVGVMRQLVGWREEGRTVRDMLLDLSPEPLQRAAAALAASIRVALAADPQAVPAKAAA